MTFFSPVFIVPYEDICTLEQRNVLFFSLKRFGRDVSRITFNMWADVNTGPLTIPSGEGRTTPDSKGPQVPS